MQRRNRTSPNERNRESRDAHGMNFQDNRQAPSSSRSDWGSPDRFRQADTRGVDYRGYEDYQQMESFPSHDERDESERWGRMRGYENEERGNLHGSECYRPPMSDSRYVSSSSRDENQHEGSYAGRGPKGFKRSDERIKEEVCEMLTRHRSLDASGVEVEVRDGEVCLSGAVPERRMKRLAEDCAEQCYGVIEVTNSIRVHREGTKEPSSEGWVDSKLEGASEQRGSSSSVKQNPSH